MSQQQVLRIALAGNPNCGKSSLFNAMTGLNQKVGNFPGVTVDKKTAKIQLGSQSCLLIDLPGAYSLNPRSMDEAVVQSTLLNPKDPIHPDLVIILLDADNLKRNLYLASQIIDLGLPCVFALNMLDVAENHGKKINATRLSETFGVPVVPINAKSGHGVDALKKVLIDPVSPAPLTPTSFMNAHQVLIEALRPAFEGQNDYQVYRNINNVASAEWMDSQLVDRIKKLLTNHQFSMAKAHLDEISDRYRMIDLKLEQIITITPEKTRGTRLQDRLDGIFMHRIWGSFIFLGVFFLLFQAVFSLASIPMDWIDQGMGLLVEKTSALLPKNAFSDFITQGILAGLSGIVIFIPQIMILFGLITLLEDSGYMARVSFLNDRLLSKAGMNGKSIVPIVGGFACAVPAIMAARSIENKRERLITIMITPLMSCSARLPVYVFLIAFIIPEENLLGFINLQGLFMLGLYLLGIFMSVIVASLLNTFLKKDSRGSFILELPSYKIPRLQNVLNSMINKAKTFVFEAGKIILIVSMVLWVLASFGPGDHMNSAESKVRANASLSASETELMVQSERLKASYAGALGQFIEPAIRPLGFDWKTGIALISSFAAREVFVGTMSTIYSVEGSTENIRGLQEKLMNEKDPITGLPIFSFATAFSLLIFYVFAMQCMSTLAIVYKETGSWKWVYVQFFLYSGIAYIGSLITYSLLT